jgi:iron(III) transport system permease protein
MDNSALSLRSRLLGRPGERTASIMTFVLIVILAVLVLVPVGYLLYGAVRSGPPRSEGAVFTLANLATIYGSTDFLEPFLNTILIGVGTGILGSAMGVVLTWIIVRLDIPRPGVWEKIIILPLYLSPLMLSLAYMALAAPRTGFINEFANALGLTGPIVNVYSFLGVIFVLSVHYVPYAILVLAAPMRAISAELEEAAYVLGSSRWQTARHITLPMLGPAIFSVALIIATLSAENFAVPTLLGREDKIRTIPSEIYYWLSYAPSDPNRAAAASTMLLLITMTGIYVYRRMTSLSSRFVTVTGKPKPMPRAALGRARPFVMAVLYIYVFVSIVLPLCALVFGSFFSFLGRTINFSHLTLNNYRTAFSGQNLQATFNTLLLAAIGALVATILGFLISYCVQRTRVRGRSTLDYLSALPIAVPGMVLAVGMLWAYVGLPFGIWGSIWMLLIAYVARFIVHSVRATNTSLLQISGEMEEAARVMGANMYHRLRDIVMPLSKRALLSSWVLVAIFIINEVTATILLYSPRSVTLSVVTWHALDMYGAMQAFALAVIQGVITAILVGISYKLAGKTSW